MSAHHVKVKVKHRLTGVGAIVRQHATPARFNTLAPRDVRAQTEEVCRETGIIKRQLLQ